MICSLLEIIGHLDDLQNFLSAWPKWHSGSMAGSLTRISAELDMLGDRESGDVAARAAGRALGLPMQAIHNLDAEDELGRMMQ
ncbi:hypothetical protein LCGC14_0318780 [marine sediment metagenome]|uniref:Uncharacterized protein n=1 Tax=marine sediment metagenome TaxID=412755 RepID=A0A0F9U2Q9_9ZZZZ